jgi:hypothetical protein
MIVSSIAAHFGFDAAFVPDTESVVTAGYTSDLLSDVMANAVEDAALITIQAHKNTIAVASLAGISAVIVCNGRVVPDDMRRTRGYFCALRHGNLQP